MALTTGAFQTSRGVMDGALEQRAAKDPLSGRRVGLRVFPACEWLALVSSIMMIHNLKNRVNTFYKQNVLMAPLLPDT